MSTVGFDGCILSTLCSGMTPIRSFLKLAIQVSIFPLWHCFEDILNMEWSWLVPVWYFFHPRLIYIHLETWNMHSSENGKRNFGCAASHSKFALTDGLDFGEWRNFPQLKSYLGYNWQKLFIVEKKKIQAKQ